MKKLEENLMAWLGNAHAMEEQAETMLKSLAGRTGDYPDVKASALLTHPDFEVGDVWSRFLLAYSQPLLRRFAVDGALDREQFVDPSHSLRRDRRLSGFR